MAAAIYDISLEQGADYTATFTYTDAENNPVNIETWDAEMMVKTDYVSSSSLDLTKGQGLTLASNGTLVVNLTATQTQGLPPLNYVYDLLLHAPGGPSIRLVQGRVFVRQSVTK